MVAGAAGKGVLDLRSAIVRAPLVISPYAIAFDAITLMHDARSAEKTDAQRQSCCNTLDLENIQAEALSSDVRASCVLAVEQNRLVGILTERDVVRLCAQQQLFDRVTVGQIMTHPVIALRESALTDARSTLRLFQQHRIHHLPILDEQDRPVGLITDGSLQALNLQKLHHYSHAEVQLEAQNSLLAKIARDEALSDILNGLIELIEQQFQGAIGSVLLIDADNRLHLSAAPHLPQAYNDATRGVRIGEGVGSCGTAAFRGEAVIVADIAQDPLWQNFKTLALSHGLQACWSSPILASDGRVLGTFGVYYQTVRSPEASELELVNQVAHIAGIAIEREQSKQTLRQNEERYSLATRAAKVGVWEWNIKTNDFYLDPNIKALLGYTDAEIPNDLEYWVTFVHPDDREAVMAAAQAHLEGATLEYVFEHRMLHKDGSTVWILVRGQVLRDEQGNPERMLGTDTDISDRKAAEIALQERETQFRRLAEHIPGAIYRYISYPNGHDEYTYLSPCIQELYGIEPEAAIQDASQLWSKVHPEDVPTLKAQIAHVTQNEQTFHAEYRVLNPDSGLKWIEEFANFEQQSNGAVLWDGVMLDISDRKRLETDRKKAEIMLQRLVESTAATTGQDFFPALVGHMAEALNVSYVFVAEKIDNQLQNLAFWANGSLQPFTVYPLTKTPCEQALQQGMFYCDLHVQNAFPEAPFLVELGAESYLGIALLDNQGQVIGNLCILDRKPIRDPQQAENLLRIFGARAAVEIERKRASTSLAELNQELEIRVAERTAELQESQHLIEQVTESSTAILYIYDLVENYNVYVNSQVSEILGYSPEQIKAMGNNLFANLIYPDDLPHVIQRMERFLTAEDREVLDVEYRMRRATGEWCWLQSRDRVFKRTPEGLPWQLIGTAVDISDRKQAEAALQIKEEQYRTIFETVSDGLFINDLETGQLLAVNPAACQMHGYTHEEMLCISSWDYIHPDSQPRFETYLKTLRAGKQLFIQAVDMRKNGEAFDIEVVGTPFLFNGKRCGLGLVRDISDRKAVEAALRQSEERYRLLTEVSPVGIFRFDTTGQCTYLNETTSKLIGYSQDAIFQDGWLITIHPDDREYAYEYWQDYMKRAKIDPTALHRLEFRQLCPDGSVVWILGQAVAERDATGNIIGYMGTLTDISDRKQTEQALQQLNQDLETKVQERTATLQEREQFLQTVLDTFSLSVFWKNRESVFLGCNRNFLRNTGLASVEELIGKTDNDLPWSETESDAYRADDLQVMQSNTAKLGIVETQIQADGKQIWLETNKWPLHNLQGEVVGVLGTYQDISDRKRAEAQLQKNNAELARATHLKDEFLANMSHELRTPLNAVLGMAEGLQEEVFGPISPKQHKALQTIERSGSHLLELINDILDLSKIESGHVTLDYTSTAVIPLCQASLAFVKQQAFKKRIQLSTELPPHLPDLWVDERRIRQVLINLLNNAVKFTPEGGHVVLTVNHRPPSAGSIPGDREDGKDTLRIAVNDTGIGIAPEDLTKLFQPFVQIDSALNRKYNGTGLGLGLVKRIVDLHGGQVEVTSEVGVGSCFTIDLPCSTAMPASPKRSTPSLGSSPPRPVTHSSSPLILLVEDNDANISTLSSYLRAKGYRIVVAKNGQEAIHLSQSENPDLILMDVQMPEMDGLEAIGQIRQDPTSVDVPIIALTGLAMTGDRERCLAAGANDYLSKPVKLKQLTVTIQSLLEAKEVR